MNDYLEYWVHRQSYRSPVCWWLRRRIGQSHRCQQIIYSTLLNRVYARNCTSDYSSRVLHLHETYQERKYKWNTVKTLTMKSDWKLFKHVHTPFSIKLSSIRPPSILPSSIHSTICYYTIHLRLIPPSALTTRVCNPGLPEPKTEASCSHIIKIWQILY